MRWLIIIGALLALLACLHPINQTPNLDWLAGCWHDPEHESTRLVFTRPCNHGVTGLLTTANETIVLAIDPSGELTIRRLGTGLTQNTPPQELPLMEMGPQQLRYNHVSLRHVSARTEASELVLEVDGQTLRLQPD